MGEFIGEVKPLYGRWTWPLRVMKPGDWFIVDKALRSPEEVRNLMGVRASQLGIRVSITKHPEEYPGFTKVELVDQDKAEEKPDAQDMDWSTAKQKLSQWYGYDIDRAPFGEVYAKGELRVNAKGDDVPISRMILDAHEHSRVVGFVFDPAGFTMHSLPRGASLGSWKVEELKALRIEDVMS